MMNRPTVLAKLSN